MSRRLTIEEMQELARKRGGTCLSKKYDDNETKLLWRCKEGHIWMAVPASVKRGTWCPVCARKQTADSKKLTIEEIQELAQKNGGKCLSKEYISTYRKLRWRCHEGHVWMAGPGSVRRGTWCPVCATRERRLSIEEMQELARERGGQCMSRKYTNNRTKLRWRCKEGHVWSARPADLKRGQWCPVCGRKKTSDSRRLTIEEMDKLAERRQGSCLSRKYKNTMTKLKWRCAEGHTWWAIPSNINRGHWCPECAVELRSRPRRKKGKRGIRVLMPSDFTE